MKNYIIPSLIAKSQKELDKRIKKVKFTKVMQIDIMDGKFLSSKSFDFDFKLPKSIKYQTHLMIKDPEDWINKNYKKTDTIIFHIESTKNPKKIIKLIKSKKRKIGIAIKPRTSIQKIKPYLKDLDMVLIMTVNPGFYGAKFLHSTLKKVTELRKLKPKMDIEVDGGITDKTILLALNAGANQFISGSYLQKTKYTKKVYNKLKEIIK